MPPRERGLNTQTDVVVGALCSNRCPWICIPDSHAQGFEDWSQLTNDGDARPDQGHIVSSYVPSQTLRRSFYAISAREEEPAVSVDRAPRPPDGLQAGDRLVDQTGEWEVVGRPYTTAGGKGDRAGDEEPHILEFQAVWAENFVRRSWPPAALTCRNRRAVRLRLRH